MNIKTKYNLGDTVSINGLLCRVYRINCDIAQYPPTGDTEVHVQVYGERKATTKDGRTITLGDGAYEQDVVPVLVKDKTSIQEATEAINKTDIHNLADKTYAEEDL